MKSKRFGMRIKTPHGNFYLEATERGLYRLEFPVKGEKGRRMKGEGRTPRRVRDKLIRVNISLRRYFKGNPIPINKLRIDLSDYTSFERNVLKALACVKPGTTVSYGELAKRAGFPGAARAVGTVMRKNRLPIIFPCHRVVHSGGGLGGYSQGLYWKRKLLALEKTQNGPAPKRGLAPLNHRCYNFSFIGG